MQPLDYEDWELAFEAYEGNSVAALNNGFCLMIMKGYLSYDPPKIREVIDGIDQAIGRFVSSTLNSMVYAYDMYRKVVGGELTPEEEETLKKLGIKF